VPRSFVAIATITMLVWGGSSIASRRQITPTTASTTTTSPTSSKPAKVTPVERLLDSASPVTGQLSKQAALRLFSMLFGAVPGVTVPPNKERGLEATLAVRSVMAHFDEYTPKQQRAIRRLLEPPPGTITVTLKPGNAGQPRPTASTHPPEERRNVLVAARAASGPQKLADLATSLIDKFDHVYQDSQRFGPGTGPNTITLEIPPSAPSGQNYLGWELPAPDDPESCQIWLVARDLQNPRGNALLVAHELFHCFQDAIDGGKAKVPQWIGEGSAEWAASEVQSAQTSSWWRTYTTKPSARLFSRTYSALGFYAHLTEVGINPYKVIPAMLRADSNEAAFAASGANSNQFLDSWASGYFRGEIPGKDWTMTGPGLAKYPQRATPVSVSIPKELPDGRPFATKAYTNSIYRLKTAADVLQVDVDPESHVRISDGSTDVNAHTTTIVWPNLIAPPEDVNG